ncbi:MAG: response regulator [Bdellovibrionales bacterium]|nr:response regulator [Bdellovibrionales bacterium]
MTILIVEDIESMREALEHLLSVGPPEGGPSPVKRVLRARNTWEARGEIRRHRPDLVLLDEVLPGESSVDLLEELREEGIPVILLTSLEERDHPVPLGALGRVLKPGEAPGSWEPARKRLWAAFPKPKS